MNFIRIARLDFTNILRNPMLMIINTITPLLLVAGFGLVTQNEFGKGSISAYDYYGVTTMIFSAMMICLTVTNTFMEEKVKRGNLRVAYTPISKAGIYLTKLVATYIFGTIVFGAITIIEQYVFHINFGGRNILYILLLINVLVLFGCCLGTMFCSILKSEEMANTIMPLVVIVLVFFSGFFFPIGHFGKTVQEIAHLSPATWATECAFRIIYDNDFDIYPNTIAFLLIASVVCIIISQIAFKPEEYL